MFFLESPLASPTKRPAGVHSSLSQFTADTVPGYTPTAATPPPAEGMKRGGPPPPAPKPNITPGVHHHVEEEEVFSISIPLALSICRTKPGWFWDCLPKPSLPLSSKTGANYCGRKNLIN